MLRNKASTSISVVGVRTLQMDDPLKTMCVICLRIVLSLQKD